MKHRRTENKEDGAFSKKKNGEEGSWKNETSYLLNTGERGGGGEGLNSAWMGAMSVCKQTALNRRNC